MNPRPLLSFAVESLSVVLALQAVVCAQSNVSFAALNSPVNLNHSTHLIQGRNEINGTVFGESGRPVPDVYVELLDDVNSTLARSKTTQSGRFSFSNLVNGRYVVRVLPYGTD